MFRSPSRMSAKTGVAPQCTITFAVAGHVSAVVITSSPGRTPTASRARWSAAVPDETASTWFASRYSAARRSSSAARGPVVSQPDRIVSATASISSSPTAGGWNERKVARRARLNESSGIGGDEAYALRRRVGPRERLVARVADREDRAGAVGAAAERPDDEPGLAVDPPPPHALEVVGPLDPLEHPRPRNEEARDRAADPRLVTVCYLHSPADRGVDRPLVQRDPEHGLGELRVVAAAEPRGHLD